MARTDEKNLRCLFPKSVKTTIQQLQLLKGITKKKLDKLVSYVYDVDLKSVSRPVLTSLKKGKTRKILDEVDKHDNTLSNKVYGFCGCIGSGNINEYDPLQKRVNKKRGTKSKTNKSSRRKSRRKTKRSKRSCSKKGKRRSKKSSKRRNKKKSQRRR